FEGQRGRLTSFVSRADATAYLVEEVEEECDMNIAILADGLFRGQDHDCTSSIRMHRIVRCRTHVERRCFRPYPRLLGQKRALSHRIGNLHDSLSGSEIIKLPVID